MRIETFGQDLPYDVRLSSSVYSDEPNMFDEWRRESWSTTIESQRGDVRFDDVPAPISEWDDFLFLEPEGGYPISARWYDDGFRTGTDTFVIRTPLVPVVKIENWSIYDRSSGWGYYATASFTIPPVEKAMSLAVTGTCEVYGEDYRFDSTVQLNEGDTGFDVTSRNSNSYNNTQFRCRFSAVPTHVDGEPVQEGLLSSESLF